MKPCEIFLIIIGGLIAVGFLTFVIRESVQNYRTGRRRKREAELRSLDSNNTNNNWGDLLEQQ